EKTDIKENLESFLKEHGLKYEISEEGISISLRGEGADRIPEASIDGGGHECAGSIKFVEGLRDKVLSRFIDILRGMKGSANDT
ncbi:MAG TPA: hypothetical protein EYP47_03385, partial [Methanococcaceae archaeon]|nr:hypothetical protein [Methanococcaceae archaeon]